MHLNIWSVTIALRDSKETGCTCESLQTKPLNVRLGAKQRRDNLFVEIQDKM